LNKRPERDPLSRERIIQTALDISDREGLEAVSMRRLGAELGVEAMSLYRQMQNKEALLKGLHAAMLAEVRHHDGPSGDWKERLRVVMRSLRAVYLAHPAIAQLSSKMPPGEVSFIHFEQDLATMEEAGFSAEEAGYALRSLLAFTMGFSAREVSRALAKSAGLEEESPDAQRTLEQYPHVVASYPYLVGDQRERGFEYGLERLLTGIELERHRSRP
jgi:AcrR family transcriptional regulator